MERRCKRCGCEIKGKNLGYQLKFLKEESEFQWIWRHVRRLFVFILHGFKRPEIEGYIELCNNCYFEFQDLLSGGDICKNSQ